MLDMKQFLCDLEMPVIQNLHVRIDPKCKKRGKLTIWAKDIPIFTIIYISQYVNALFRDFFFFFEIFSHSLINLHVIKYITHPC